MSIETTFPQEVVFARVSQRTGVSLWGEIRTEIPSLVLEEKYGMSSKKTARTEFDDRFPEYDIQKWHDMGSNGYEFRGRRRLKIGEIAASHGTSMDEIFGEIEKKVSQFV